MAKKEKKLEVVNRCIKNCTKWYWATNDAIPLEKFNNACRSYAGNVSTENAIAIIDETILGSGKKGMLFTDDGIYYSTSTGGQYFPYSEPQWFENRSGYNCVALNEMIQELNNIETAPSGLEILGGFIDETLNFLSELSELTNDESKENVVENDEINGNGTYIAPDGKSYEGEFKDGRYHGYGIMIFPSGDKYEGNWKYGDFNGKGTYIFHDGIKYEGEFKDGNYSNGTLIFPGGKKYEGEFKDGNYHGYGIMMFPNGQKYEGEWRYGKYSGNGIFTFPEGAKYEGEWKDGKYHGKGTYIFRDGRKIEGKWENGTRLV